MVLRGVRNKNWGRRPPGVLPWPKPEASKLAFSRRLKAPLPGLKSGASTVSPNLSAGISGRRWLAMADRELC
jgi:hypothetical protein